MCANCSNNNLMGTNNSNGVGLFIENGNMPVLGTFSNEMPTNVLGNNNLQRNLRNFIGRRCTCEFNICGTCFKRTGVLSCVGNDFITLAGVNNSNCMLCNTDGLSFVTIHNCNG